MTIEELVKGFEYIGIDSKKDLPLYVSNYSQELYYKVNNFLVKIEKYKKVKDKLEYKDGN